ncbi:MAG TPA: hypothetical protein ENK82_03225 [Campylobacterales bacterium]|nr:hypothetical protein [Campylobacterales bacterium]
MSKSLEYYLPKAMDAIEQLKISNEKGEVPKQFNGYISSFGASLRQAGLLATVLVYRNENANAEESREKVVLAIEKMLGESIVVNNAVAKTMRNKVEQAAIALKLALRSYKLV